MVSLKLIATQKSAVVPHYYLRFKSLNIVGQQRQRHRQQHLILVTNPSRLFIVSCYSLNFSRPRLDFCPGYTKSLATQINEKLQSLLGISFLQYHSDGLSPPPPPPSRLNVLLHIEAPPIWQLIRVVGVGRSTATKQCT